jgi:hypothetical protein
LPAFLASPSPLALFLLLNWPELPRAWEWDAHYACSQATNGGPLG